MLTAVERTKAMAVRGSGAASKSSDNGAQIHIGRLAEKEMDLVGFATKLHPRAPISVAIEESRSRSKGRSARIS